MVPRRLCFCDMTGHTATVLCFPFLGTDGYWRYPSLSSVGRALRYTGETTYGPS